MDTRVKPAYDDLYLLPSDVSLDLSELPANPLEPADLLAGDECPSRSLQGFDARDVVITAEIQPGEEALSDQDLDAQAVADPKVPLAFVAQFEKDFTLASGEFFRLGPRNTLQKLGRKFRSLACIVRICQQMPRQRLEYPRVLANTVDFDPGGYVPAPMC